MVPVAVASAKKVLLPAKVKLPSIVWPKMEASLAVAQVKLLETASMAHGPLDEVKVKVESALSRGAAT